jgi:thiamine biosynthesis lipoprotein
MGTHWQIDALIPPALDSDVLEQVALDILRDVNAQMSHWDPDSVLSQFNRAAAGTRVTIPDAFYKVLDYALYLAQQSEGALNPAAGKLINLWGFGPEGRRTEAPVPKSVQACLDAQDFRGFSQTA